MLSFESDTRYNYNANARKTYITKALRAPVTGSVTIHDIAMLRNVCHSTADVLDCTSPTATTLPILHCVDEIGKPNLLAASTVTAAPNSIAKPLKIGVH